MNFLENEWKKIRFGLPAGLDPAMLVTSKAMFYAGASATVNCIVNSPPEVVNGLVHELSAYYTSRGCK